MGVVVPIFKKDTGECALVNEESHCSTSLGNLTPGCWKENPGKFSNLRFRQNNKDSVLASWNHEPTNYPSTRGLWEFTHPVYMYSVALEKAYNCEFMYNCSERCVSIPSQGLSQWVLDSTKAVLCPKCCSQFSWTRFQGTLEGKACPVW